MVSKVITRVRHSMATLRGNRVILGLVSKFISYPFVAGSTFVNFVIIQRISPLNEFNLALQFWMILGASSLFEYTIGIGITKTFAEKGHVISAWQEFYNVVKLYSLYGFGVVITLLIAIFNSGTILSWMNPNEIESHEFNAILALGVLTIYVSGFSSLVMRVCIGLRLNHLYDYGRLVSSLIATATLFGLQSKNPPLLLMCALMTLSLFLPGFFAFPLILRLIPGTRSSSTRKKSHSSQVVFQTNDKVTEVHKRFDILYFFVACLFFLNFALPRFMIELKTENDTAAYLLILVVVNTVFSIVSGVSPQLWVDGLTQKLSRELITNRYKLLLVITAIACPVYLILLDLVFLIVLKVNVFSQYLTQSLLGLVLLISYTIHTVASNLLSRRIYQLKLLFFLIVQLLLTIVFIDLDIFSGSSQIALMCLAAIHFSTILVPTASLLLVARKG
jgi:hypothetical protein